MQGLRLVCLSDTHNRHDHLRVPDGDVLLHAGDFTGRGTPREIAAFGAFLARLPHRSKVVIAGNHDFLFQDESERARELLGDVTYLEDSPAEVAGLRVWGSPWQPWFHDWAFNLPRGAALAEKWALVPAAVDVLVTHGPPHGILDRTSDGRRVGCEELAAARARIRPRLHLFGHIHEAYGTHRADGILSVNACNCDLGYRPVNPPVVLDWGGEGLLLAGERHR
jgi:predicted phosphodiesterase